MPAILRASVIVVLLLGAALVWQQPTATQANGVAAISAGGYHTCALTAVGGIKCWGSNDAGQLGDGYACGTYCSTPVDVPGLTSGVAAVSAGNFHTCAVTTSGAVKCWGYNNNGQLGNGTTTTTGCYCIPTPVDVSGLTSGAAAVSAGKYHTCALTAGGGVKCWGGTNAYYSELGDGTTTPSSTPVDVWGLTSGVSAISAGESHSCALTTTGGVKCWGNNVYGEMGDDFTSLVTPVDVTGLTSGVAAISAAGEHHTCALTSSGGVKCLGANHIGQLGDGQACSAYFCTAPVDVTGLTSGVSAISTGVDHTCALTAGGAIKCWGWNSPGALGDGTTTNSSTPVNVMGLTSGIAAVSAGQDHTCALTTDGGVTCWGWNYYGQLGNGTTTGPETCAEFLFCSTTPLNVFGLGEPPDSDGDGCPDIRELVTGFGAQNSGGNRGPKNPWDYFNPTGDGENRVDDILAVVDQYFKDDNDGTPGFAPFAPGYTQVTDRTSAGPNLWNTGPPNGLQRVDDILNAVYQYFHDCA